MQYGLCILSEPKNNLTIDEIDDIFDMLDNEKKVDFDKEYIEQLYLSYFESKTA